MVFSSHLFIYYFLPLALSVYYLAPSRLRNLVLTLTSFVFYGWANPLFILLLVVSTLIDYLCGLVLVDALHQPRDAPLPLLDPNIPRSRRQKLTLATSMVANLTLLGFFKYYNFALASWNEAAAAAGLESLHLDSVLRVVLPLGISFYTFQSMSYAIDVYRGEARAMRSLVDFFCFESMFPQLVAGPIIRFSEVADQLATRTLSSEKFARGVAFFALGLFKKVVLANPCGAVADATFNAASVATADAWYGLIAYAFQISFDFSGYSDMAVGLGLMFGFVFAKNFDSPYVAESLTDFWRRWHISLSTWLRDYLYRPLGGNRKGRRRTYLHLAVVMLLGGLWHGAAWTFVIWGGIHGAVLALERASGKTSLWHRLPRPLRIAATFATVLLAWVFFRARDLPAAYAYLAALAGSAPASDAARLVSGLLYRPYDVLAVATAALVVWTAPQTWDWTKHLTLPRAALAMGAFVLALVVLATQSYNPFIYFIF